MSFHSLERFTGMHGVNLCMHNRDFQVAKTPGSGPAWRLRYMESAVKLFSPKKFPKKKESL